MYKVYYIWPINGERLPGHILVPADSPAEAEAIAHKRLQGVEVTKVAYHGQYVSEAGELVIPAI